METPIVITVGAPPAGIIEVNGNVTSTIEVTEIITKVAKELATEITETLGEAITTTQVTEIDRKREEDRVGPSHHLPGREKIKGDVHAPDRHHGKIRDKDMTREGETKRRSQARRLF